MALSPLPLRKAALLRKMLQKAKKVMQPVWLHHLMVFCRWIGGYLPPPAFLLR